MKWREGAGAPMPVARSAPNDGAPAAVSTAANSDGRSAVGAAVDVAAAADYYHYYYVDARDD